MKRQVAKAHAEIGRRLTLNRPCKMGHVKANGLAFTLHRLSKPGGI